MSQLDTLFKRLADNNKKTVLLTEQLGEINKKVSATVVRPETAPTSQRKTILIFVATLLLLSILVALLIAYFTKK